MPYGRVLLVDDVESNLFVAKGLLMPYRLSVDTAVSGYDAIAKLENGEKYDIIFMDHMMPEMDGIEAVQIIRSMGYDEPIVALTANTIIGQADIFMENGFNGFISKPIDINLLNSFLLRYVRDRHPDENGAVYVEEAETGDFAEQKTDIFLRDADKALAALTPFAEERTAGALRLFVISAHGMKSALTSVGETDLSRMSLDLETAGAAILNETPIYVERLRTVMQKLAPAVEIETENSGEKITEADEKYLREKLVELVQACDDFEVDEADAIIQALLKKSWPGKTKTALMDMSYSLLLGDYDEVVKISTSIL